MLKKMLKSARDWLNLADYERGKHAAERKTVSRFARGNIALQNGRYLSAAEFEQLRERGEIALDAAIDKLQRANAN